MGLFDWLFGSSEPKASSRSQVLFITERMFEAERPAEGERDANGTVVTLRLNPEQHDPEAAAWSRQAIEEAGPEGITALILTGFHLEQIVASTQSFVFPAVDKLWVGRAEDLDNAEYAGPELLRNYGGVEHGCWDGLDRMVPNATTIQIRNVASAGPLPPSVRVLEWLFDAEMGELHPGPAGTLSNLTTLALQFTTFEILERDDLTSLERLSVYGRVDEILEAVAVNRGRLPKLEALDIVDPYAHQEDEEVIRSHLGWLRELSVTFFVDPDGGLPEFAEPSVQVDYDRVPEPFFRHME